jgi:alpha-beta hydrolase superfamily lysophospholipase
LKQNDFELKGLDGQAIACTAWLPEGASDQVRATLQIAHGMGEHRLRYRDFAEALTDQNYAVYASDHRGHVGSMVKGAPGAMGENGWRQTLSDMNCLAEHAARLHRHKPAALIGHSMGAALAQQYLYLYGDHLAAAVLSGSPGFGSKLRLLLVQLLARLESLRGGPDTQRKFLQGLLFGKHNEPFDTPDATGFEWLSKDVVQVERYVLDPDCGFVLSPNSLAEMFAGMRQASETQNIAAIPHSLPIYVFSGEDDPVHAEEVGLIALVESYRNAGLAVDYKLYPEGRHEMLNETNRVEVVANLLEWLDMTLVGHKSTATDVL